jgi:TIR domain
MTAPSYSAFISYKSSSRRAAERLKRDLYAIAKRHPGHPDFRIFLDASDLRPGPLSDEIRAAVERSRCLVVLLDTTTVESAWVAQEITHWLEHGGTPDRLFLVRADPALDLDWDEDASAFHAPLGIPAPLRTLFDVEQKWIDYSARPLLRSTAGLAGLCAKLMDAEASEYLLEEATFQRRRARIITVVAIVMTLLTAAATISAVTAVRNQRTAERNAAQARAQADASEALLAAPDSPTLAIERALRAAKVSDTPTVRSAMLAVSQAARRLKRALVYPQPVSAARFTQDGATLLAWGAGRDPGTSTVLAWTIASGALEVNVTVDATELRDVTIIGDDHLAACSASGPVLVDVAASRTSKLGGGRCEVHEYAAGVVLLGEGTAYAVDRAGAVTTIDGVDSVATRPQSPAAALAGRAGVMVVTSGPPLPVSAAPGSTMAYADTQGGFVARTGASEWGVVTVQDGVPAMQALTVPATAVAVAPVLDLGRVTGELAWMDDDGTIGWTVDDRRTKLANRMGEPAWAPYQTSLEPLPYRDFVAVYRNTATVVRPPSDSVPIDAPLNTLPPNWRTDWTQVVVNERLGVPGSGGTDPIVASCDTAGGVLLRTDLPENGELLVDGDAEGHRLNGDGQFTAGCTVIDAGRSLSAMGRDGPVVLRATLVADSVAVSPMGNQVAIVKAGFPIEVLSTVKADSLPRPWDVAVGQRGEVTALGERELLTNGRELVIAGSSGVVDRVPIPPSARVAAAKPDGTGAALVDAQRGRVLLADGRSVTEAARACWGKNLTYLPRPGFDHSYAAAEAQVPAARVDGATFIDCRTGRELSPGAEILSYEIGQRFGRIVARSQGRMTVTTWTRANHVDPRTWEGPPLPPDRGAASFDPAAQAAVVYAAGSRDLTVYRRDGDAWTSALNLVTGLPEVVAAELVDAGSLVLAVSRNGGFELFDAATGRLVASDPVLAITSTSVVVDRISARTAGDRLSVELRQADSSAAGVTIQIPIGIPAIKRQLCALYPAQECVR